MATLQEAAFKRLYTEEYFDKFFAGGDRPDGRGLSVCRPVSIALNSVSSADGSATVKVGKTTVLAGVRLEVMVPSSDTPAHGQLVVSVVMTALATPDYRPGKQPGIINVIQQRLTDILQGCNVLKLSDLCIAEGQAVWVVYLDIYVLNAAGSLLDASLLAAVAALQDTRVPEVHLTQEGNVERNGLDNDEAAPADGAAAAAGQSVPLQLHDKPLCLTCGLYKEHLVVDPDHEEEALMAATISMVLDNNQDLLGV
eukprot:GHRR01032460.1.p1 GENE.GHRR01032460.1~~GHRR01032460.1.p1  ORF type:complete len:254 (+),score=86.74 GHRR01032460.1:107-868(+)